MCDYGSSYEPYEPHYTSEPSNTPQGAQPAASRPPDAPQREYPRMVAPGPGVPTPDDQELVSRRLWERLEFQPVASAPALTSTHVPDGRLSAMCENTRSMWGHIGQGASINLHPSPNRGDQGSTSQMRRQPLVTPDLGGARPDHEEAAQLSRAEAMTCLLYTSDAADE